ncbi:NADH-quinone oxidoreductase subunit J [Telmatospirillum siberiense]|uniref:NADH-quinone oxidoreductase subunit J n=1 Tax=Telmatospirillum siberiense TaxID=382514 RepID=A0A2N3Q0F7_9PROT|nr:NADH-quinone oxidoreductase subunit J [Telmatospirillum siberiense]PKU26148.1 NADH-quinone oxidoreductase subunit J [Telmatospirillum siberiense]
MEILAKIAFALHALIILGGALVAVSSKSLVRALVGLVVTFFGVAGMYLLLATPFLAFMQILIYVGAVCVLVFFSVMLTRADGEGEEARPVTIRHRFNALLAGLVPAVGLALVLIRHPGAARDLPVEVGLPALGTGLLEQYSLSFELISLILLVAMSGAVVLTWERKEKQ